MFKLNNRSIGENIVRELKTKRLVKFDGRCSSWSHVDEHNRQLKIAKKLEEAGFGNFVCTTELAPVVESDDKEKVKLSECTYYESDGPTLVSDREYKELRKAGVNVTVLGIYEDERTRYFDIVFYAVCILFVVWNIAALYKFVV